eukprot:INCI2272.1.p1 GENE.INCI2272.1~~INCI2272.1.p1  ORF type:complete len:216 (-),score=34.57 INCI2272.1:201-848(-)
MPARNDDVGGLKSPNVSCSLLPNSVQCLRWSLLFCALSQLVHKSSAMDATSTDIIGESQFNRTVLESPFVTLVEFHSGMCGSCRLFAPTWDELSWGPLLTGVKFVRADIDDPENLELAVGRNLLDNGVPCIVLFSEADDLIGHVVMDGDNKVAAQTLGQRVLDHLKLSRSAASKNRFVREGLLKEGAFPPGEPPRAQRQYGKWLSELSRLFGSDL